VSPVTPSQHGANASIKDGSVLLHPRNVVIIIVINA
jgi:hypothetical protein